MNEMTMNQDCMYQNVQEIHELNHVEGFDPRKYMRLLANDGQSARYYLDVVYRKLWFRLKYPNGKIVKTLKKLTDQVAIVEARIYLDRSDPEESFISNALAQKYMSSDDQFGNKYVELAETAAVGRALADAGFGLQFADLEGETDPNIVDAGLEHMTAPDPGSLLPAGTCLEEDAGETLAETEEQLPGQYDINDYIGQDYGEMPFGQEEQMLLAMAGNVPPMMQQTASAATQQNRQGTTKARQAQSRPRTANSRQTQPSASNPQNGSGQNTASAQGGQPSIQDTISRIQRDLPVEQIYKMLNRDMATSLVISAGCYKDKYTLGQLAIEKPQSLSWYVNDYKGPDNLLRAAARFLLDAAKQAA